jgi:hypothetical protein
MVAKGVTSVDETNLCVLWKGEVGLEQILTLCALGWVLDTAKMAS